MRRRFDRDGIDDLAISAPGSYPGGDEVVGAGLFVYSAVKLNHGSGGATSRKIALGEAQYLTELNLGVPLQTSDRFGASLSAGDFDGDGIDDLAVGIPHRTTGGVDGGAVQILTGVHNGSLTRGAMLNAASLSGSSVASGERFGVAVLAKNFDPEIGSRADLIVGAPGSGSGQGHAYVFRGTSSGISAQAKLQSNSASPGGDRFGDALAAGDFDGRTVSGKRIPYLAIGADQYEGGYGAIYVFARAQSGFTFTLSEGLEEPTLGASNHFGAVLGTGVVDSSGNEALLVGVPDHAGGGNLDIYRHTSGYSAPLEGPLVSNGGVVSGDSYGSAVATGDFTGVAGAQNEVVVGSSGWASGAGKLRLGDVTGATSMSWQSPIDQESASPE